MKNILPFIIITLFFAQIKAQNTIQLNQNTKRYSYYQIFDSIPKTTNQIYKQAKVFLKVNNEESKYIADIPNQKITIPYYFIVRVKMRKIPIAIPVRIIWNVEIKPKRYRVTISNFYVTQNSSGTTAEQTLYDYCNQNLPPTMGKRIINKFHSDLIKEINNLIHTTLTQLNQFIKQKQEKEDW